MERINVVCVASKPASYQAFDIRYIEKTYCGVRRNLDLDFDFFCMTDNPDIIENGSIYDINFIPLEQPVKRYWSKIEIFRPNLFEGPVVYLDLDVVITKNITALVEYAFSTNEFFMTKSSGSPPYSNSSIMMFKDPRNYDYLHQDFFSDPELNCFKYHRGGLGNMGDQMYIAFNVLHHKYLEQLKCSIMWCQKSHVAIPSVNPHFVIMTGTVNKPHNVHKIKDDAVKRVQKLVEDHWILD